MMASIIEPARAVNPIGRWNTSLIIGTINWMPIKPITTEGIVAKTSIMGFKSSLIGLGASSPIYIAAPTPKGKAITIAPTVIKVEPKSKGTRPNFSILDVGAHFVPVKNWKKGYPEKNLKEL
jgi:hypothetical protein